MTKRKDFTGVTSHAESLSYRSNGAQHDSLPIYIPIRQQCLSIVCIMNTYVVQ
jgi:hypothetical protein